MIATRVLRRPRVLIVGCGDIGLRCLEQLRARAAAPRIFALTSRPERREQLRAHGAVPLLGNLDQRASLARLGGLANRVLHLAPPPGQGGGDPRTAALIAALSVPARRPPPNLLLLQGQPARRPSAGLMTRAGGARLTHALSGTAARPAGRREGGLRRSRAGRFRGAIVPVPHCPVLVYTSTSGVYGDCAGAWIDETRPVRPATARGRRRVAAERHLRAATARGTLSARLVRVPGIYAEDRLPLARLRKGTPALCEADDVYTNHIHADDLARILLRAGERGRPARVYHASDDSMLKMGEYFVRVARAFDLPEPPRISRAEAAQQLDPVLLSFMSESRRMRNQRLKRELGARLMFPTVESTLRAAVSDEGRKRFDEDKAQ